MCRKENKILNELMAYAVVGMRYAVRLFCVFALCNVMLIGCGVPDSALVLKTDAQTDVTDGESSGLQIKNAHDLSDDTEHNKEQVSVQRTIFVHVCGAVQCPGVVEIPYGSRAADALAAAGGMSEDAARDYVNLAAKVQDAQQLYFPTREEEEQLLQKEIAESSGMVNINKAGVEQLCTLPGIGEARAKEIISYREQNGDFRSKEDIMQVAGIKQNAYDKLQTYITVD